MSTAPDVLPFHLLLNWAVSKSMAAAFESFSIREYVLSKRSVDLGTSWPFGEETLEKEGSSLALLPPIVCRKYRWWSFENEIRQSVSGDGDSGSYLPGNGFPVGDLGTLDAVMGTDNGVQSTAVSEKESGLEVGNSKAVLGVEKAVLGSEGGFEEDEEGSVVKICPVCRIFTSATINAVNAHIDSCLAQGLVGEKRQAKQKSRVPKKRSIVEIFAAAPQVETVEEDGDEEDEKQQEEEEQQQEEQEVIDDHDDERDGFFSYGGGNNSKQQQQPEGDEGIGERENLSKERRTRKAKRYDEELLQTRRKDKQHRIKFSSSVDFSRLPQTKLQKKRLKKVVPGHVVVRIKKLSNTKRLPKQKQLKIIRSPKLVVENRQGDPPLFPIHGILKNHIRLTSARKPSALDCSQGGSLTKRCVPHVKQSSRHVRFSGKDDILGHTKCCSPIGFSQTETLRKVISDAMADLSVADKPCSTEVNNSSRNLPAIDEVREIIEIDCNVSVRVIDGNGDQNLSDNAIPSVISSSTKSCLDIEKAGLTEPMDLNQALQQFDNLHLLNPSSSIGSHNFSYKEIQKLPNSFLKEGINSTLSSQEEGSVSRLPNTSKRLSAYVENPIARSSMVSSLATLARTATSQSSISCIGTNTESNVRPPYLLEPRRQGSNSCLLQYPLCPLPSKDLMGSFCAPQAAPKKQVARKNRLFGELKMSSSDTVSACAKLSRRDKCIDDDFLGLPLNSSGKIGFNPLSTFPIYNFVGPKLTLDHSNLQEKVRNATTPTHNLKLFPDQNHSKKNQTNRPISSRKNFPKSMNAGRIDKVSSDFLRGKKQSLFCSDSELSMMNILGAGSQDYNETQNHRRKEKTQVGRLGFFFEPTTQPTMRLMGKNVVVGRNYNEEVQGAEDAKIWKDKEIIAEHEPVVNQSFRPEWVAHPVSGASRENGNNSVETYCNPNLSNILQLTSAEAKFASTLVDCNTHLRNDLPLNNVRYGANFRDLIFPLPSQALSDMQQSKFVDGFIPEAELGHIAHQRPAPGCSPLNVCLQHEQHLSYKETSAFQFPFLNQDCGECIRSSWSPQSPLASLPQWLQPDPIAKTCSYTICETNLLHSPPSYLTSTLIFPAHKPNTSHPCLRSLASTSLINPFLVPACPGFKPTSAIKTGSRNRCKFQNKINSKLTCAQGPNNAKKTKKRPATKGGEAKKATKKTRLEMHDNSKAQAGSKNREQFCEYTQYNTGALEVDICRDKTTDTCFSAMEMEKNGSRTGTRVNYFKQDGVARSGPIKLSAGAKHILKPSQNVHQDNSRPTYSTIPFALVVGSGKEPDLQKKTAKIYRF